MEKCPGKSVGAIIERDGKLLLIDRVNIPHGWACVAGHLDYGKKPEEMIRIEVKEEVGLEVVSCKLLHEEMVPWNNCYRSGDSGHYYYVFGVNATGEVSIELKEAKDFGWFEPKEVQNLALEPVWRYFLEKLGYIKPREGGDSDERSSAATSRASRHD